MKRIVSFALLALVLALLAGTAGASVVQAAPAVCTSNIAHGLPAYSDTVTGSNAPANAVDGSTSTWWQSSNTVNAGGEHFWVDLGTATNFLSLNIYWWEAPNSFTLELSNDGSTWTTLVAHPTVDVNNVTHWTGSATARYVRLSATHTNTLDGTIAISEFAIMSPSSCTTTTKVTSSASPSVYGQPLTFTTTITASDGSSPQGTVDFQVVETSAALCTGVAVKSGKATCATTSPLAVGTHTIQATYNSANGWLTSTNSTTQTVNKANTRTSLSSTNPSVSGQPVTFTATVSAVTPGAGTLDGTVDFAVVGGDPLCTGVAVSAGKATCSLNPGLPAGASKVMASYSGSASFNPSSYAMIETLNKAGTKVQVSVSPALVNPGDPVTLTADVTVRSPGMPVEAGGNVTFRDNGEVIPGCNQVDLDSSFEATCGPVTFSSGKHAIAVNYSGSDQFLGSNTSLAGGLTVRYTPAVKGQIRDRANHTITSAPMGTVVHDQAIISGAHGAATGSVVFRLYYNLDCSGTPAAQQTLNLAGGQVASGTATQPPSGLSFQILYNGNGTYAPASGACQALPVP